MTSEQANGLAVFSDEQLNVIQQRLNEYATQAASTRTQLILNEAREAITFLRHERDVADRRGPPPEPRERALIVPWPEVPPGRRFGVVTTALSDVANSAIRDGLSPAQTEIALRSIADAILSERKP